MAALPRIRLTVALALVASVSALTVSEQAQAIEPVPNPPIEDSCGVNVTLVLDASGSIQSSNAVDDVRGAAQAFLDSLKNTDSTARVTQFATFSEVLAPTTLINDANLDPTTGVLGGAIADYYNPKPPRPGGSSIFQYDGSGATGSDGNWDLRNDRNQYTNWDQSLEEAGDEPSELVVYITDGEPTAYDLNGDTTDADPPKAGPDDVGVNTNRGSADQVMVDRAVQEANIIKSSGTRVLAIGVGSATGSAALQDRLTLISGPQLVRDADLGAIDSLNDVDVAVVTRFQDLAQFLRSVVLELCSPSLTITKRAQAPDSAEYQPAPGWAMTVTPTVPGGYDWILPDTDPDTSKTLATNANGSAQFQWEPNSTVDSVALVEEAVQAGWDPGRPIGDDYRCEARDEDGNIRSVAGELTVAGGTASFELDPIGQEVVTCTVWNSFDYESGITLTKVNAPTQIRGDLDPPATVTSTYVVENTGNSELSDVRLIDDRCSPVTLVSGDVGSDGKLPPATLPDGSDNPAAETWTFECTRSFTTPDGPTPDNVVNTATVTALDPVGTQVRSVDDDDVDIYTAAVNIEKTADVDEVPRGVPAEITYTYTVTNPASLALTNVVVTDDGGPNGLLYNATCSPVAYQSGDDGNNRLDPGEEWIFTCTSNDGAPPFVDPQGPLTNLGEVTGDPVFPDLTAAPGPVTDSDPAVVTVFDAEIDIVKTVGTDPGACGATDSVTVLPGAAATFCYVITNNGTADLRNPAVAPGPDTQNGWVTDDLGPTGTCAPVTYLSGDTENDGILQVGQSWEFRCTGTIGDDAVNTAEVRGQTLTATPLDVSDTDQATVDVVTPAIAVDKIASRPAVLDPAATPIAGPDAPLLTPAAFGFEVSNPGDLPLQDVALTDEYPIQGGSSCDPAPDVTGAAPNDFNVGDLNQDRLLDPGEIWEYVCVHNGTAAPRLTKADADDPPGLDAMLPSPVTDTAIASGTPLFGGTPAPTIQSEPATEQVLVIQPDIELTKTASPPVMLRGDTVTYTFEVENTGDVGLVNVSLFDDQCSPIYVSGDDGNGILDGGPARETWTYTCSRTLTQLGDTVNEAEVYANGPLGNLYVDEDDAVVRVIDPAIDLVKTVSESLVPVGTEVTYDFLVTNAGESPIPDEDVLAQVELGDLSDPELPSCRLPDFVGGDVANPGFLDRGEEWRYTCDATIDEPTTNLAIVTALGGTGPVFEPNELPVRVFAFDAAFVQTFEPGIEVVKSARPTQLVGSGEVTYTYEVTNTGDVPLADVAERIADDTCSPVVYVDGDLDGDDLLDTPNSIFEDAADETWRFSCTTTVTETTTNVVEVTGTPTDPGGTELCAPRIALRVDEPCDVTDQDTETVVVVAPGTVTIRKATDPPGSTQVFPFTFDGQSFQLTDGQSVTFDGLAPGVYAATEAVPDGWELDSAACDDGSPVGAIDVEAGETVVCTFVNSISAPVLPPQPPVTIPPTGGGGRAGLWIAMMFLIVGGALLSMTRRRRPA